MDDDLQQLEAELKHLQPIAPSTALAARIERELEHKTPDATQPQPTRGQPGRRGPRGPRVNWWWCAALPAAAAVAFLASRPPAAPRSGSKAEQANATVAATPAITLKPIAMENLLYSATDEGLVTLEDGTTARRERLRYVDTITWRNPRTNASLQWTVPREEVRVVPVYFQ